MIVFYLTGMIDGGAPVDAPANNFAYESRTWVGIGVATILLIMVHIKWP